MSKSNDVPYLSRFLMKFVEIIAAGFATAVSGYLIAHLSGVLSSPAPAPTAAVIKAVPSANSSVSTQPIPSNSAPIDEPSVASRHANASAVVEPTRPQQQVNVPPLAQFTRGSVNDLKPTASRKHIETTASAAESKLDQRSFTARIQAALRNVDQAETNDGPLRPNNTMTANPAPVPGVSAATAATPASGTDVRPSPRLATPIQPDPPGPIEVESRPVISVPSTPAPAPGSETGVVSGLDEILRHDPFASSGDAPRPPLPVGQ
jgi:hypothetical protein